MIDRIDIITWAEENGFIPDGDFWICQKLSGGDLYSYEDLKACYIYCIMNSI